LLSSELKTTLNEN